MIVLRRRKNSNSESKEKKGKGNRWKKKQLLRGLVLSPCWRRERHKISNRSELMGQKSTAERERKLKEEREKLSPLLCVCCFFSLASVKRGMTLLGRAQRFSLFKSHSLSRFPLWTSQRYQPRVESDRNMENDGKKTDSHQTCNVTEGYGQDEKRLKRKTRGKKSVKKAKEG